MKGTLFSVCTGATDAAVLGYEVGGRSASGFAVVTSGLQRLGHRGVRCLSHEVVLIGSLPNPLAYRLSALI